MRGRERAGNAPKGYAIVLALVLLSGCTTPTTETPAPTPVETPEVTFSPVYTDWSKLEPYTPADRGEVYIRYWGEPRFTLTPSPDYGPLVAFRGSAEIGRASCRERV